jgi:DNA helicase-2/ATP-dependent DNA helicase PcrA
MTRAKDHLHLVVPQRFFVHGQSSGGDRHVYASRTRFIPDEILSLFEKAGWPVVKPIASAPQASCERVRVDVGARVRGMWR